MARNNKNNKKNNAQKASARAQYIKQNGDDEKRIYLTAQDEAPVIHLTDDDKRRIRNAVLEKAYAPYNTGDYAYGRDENGTTTRKTIVKNPTTIVGGKDLYFMGVLLPQRHNWETYEIGLVEHQIFENCVFVDSSINGIVWRDCRFINCVFKTDKSPEPYAYNIVFDHCDFVNTITGSESYLVRKPFDGNLPAIFQNCRIEAGQLLYPVYNRDENGDVFAVGGMLSAA